MRQMNESDVMEEFRSLRDELSKWARHIDEQLNAFAQTIEPSLVENIQIPAKYRIKDDNSFRSKAFYRDKKYENPILEITDKVGTRLVFLFPQSVKKMSDFIESQNGIKWIVKEKSQDTMKIRLKHPEVFSYQSDHFILMPCDGYESSKDINVLTCEVQVRTLLQHAYSEVSHALFYKQNKDQDKKALRMLAASMAFLEESDSKFEKILAMNVPMNDNRISLRVLVCNEFAKLDENYNEQKFDREVWDLFIQLLDDTKVNQALTEFSEFLSDKADILKEGISDYQKDIFLFCQPILLLATYSFVTWQTFTRVNWPYGYSSLSYIVKMLGYSDEALKS